MTDTLTQACAQATYGIAVGMLQDGAPFIASAVFGVWRDEAGNLMVTPATAVLDPAALRLLARSLHTVAADIEAGKIPHIGTVDLDSGEFSPVRGGSGN